MTNTVAASQKEALHTSKDDGLVAPLPPLSDCFHPRGAHARALYASYYRTPISATISALCGHVAGFPLDSIKTRMQTHPYRGVAHCIAKTYKSEGLHGFWRGVVSPMPVVLINKTMSFQVYESTKQYIRSSYPNTLHGEDIATYGLVSAMGGSTSGAVIALLSTPFELIKVRMQLDRLIGEDSKKNGGPIGRPASAPAPPSSFALLSSTPPSASSSACQVNLQSSASSHPGRLKQHVPVTSSLHAVREIYRAQGPFPGIYFCGTLQLARDMCGTALYFGNYEVMKRTMITYGNFPAFLAQALSGGISGVLCWLVIFPIDFVKSSRQKDGLSPNPRFTSHWHCIRHSYQGHGWRVFYRGISVTLVRAFPIHGCNLLVYEQCREFISRFADMNAP